MEFDEEDKQQNNILGFNVDDEERRKLDKSTTLPSWPMVETPTQSETSDCELGNDAANHTMAPSFYRGKSSVILIVDS